MGATPSKQQESRDSWKASLSRSISAPTNRDGSEDDSPNKVSWKSKLLSMPQSYRRGKSFKTGRIMSKLKPVKEEEIEDDSSEAFEVDINGLNPEGEGPLHSETGRLLNRCMTFQPASEMESKRRLGAPCESFVESRGGNDPSGLVAHSKSLRRRDSLDQSMGLRLLLNSSSSLSQSMVSPSRGANVGKSLSTKGSFNSRRENDFTKRSFPRVCMDDASPLEPQWVAASSTLADPELPLFDPSLLATFEKAVEAIAHSPQQTSPASKTERACLDADKPKLLKEGGRSLSRLKSLRSRAAVEDVPDDNAPQLRTFSFLHRKASFSKVLSLKKDQQNWSSQTYLDKFVKMCPPGCEGKVVLYFTSLRGVRKTFENCCLVRLILQGFRVHVDERDVWMHSRFRQELTEVMGVALSVPRLFILGRYIGGADEVELLHEEGILTKLLEELPRECRQVCQVCADVRFIPCLACSGSCTSSGVLQRCTKCNENGLIMCPMCE